ncbi:WXG100 family type VII secretion target [Nocardia sp. CA-128927]|uniref:WXG100 family type VII secretion target n=1 Tax=Nocardia sp. CA-128927 TaxID=3239975 RepID=UPI003D963915
MSDTATPSAVSPGTLTVVPEQVSAAGHYVQNTAQSLINGLRTTSSEVNALESSWRGAAATAYANAWDEVHRGAVEVFEALADMADLLGVVVDRTVATDIDTANTVSSLTLP